MNFTEDVMARVAPDDRALIELAADGSRTEHRFGEVHARTIDLADVLHGLGVRRGDVVMTLIGNRPDWVVAMMTCFRQGFVVLPCTEQLRPKDLAARLALTQPAAVVCDVRNAQLLQDAGWRGPTIWTPLAGRDARDVKPPPAADLRFTDPCLITFTSGTSGAPKAVLHGQRYLFGQALQAEHWLAPRLGDVVWCTASSGWSKSARNVFIAPWLRGACSVLHDARFDPQERQDVLRRERVNVLCMAPTEYRVMARRTTLSSLPDLQSAVAAGEALNPGVIEAWGEATGLVIRDGYGQTETGQITANPPRAEVRPGSMGRPLPGVEVTIEDGELVVDPGSVPTFFLGYGGDAPHDRATPWRTGDRVTQDEDGYLYFVGRADDVIISSGYRIGPFEVESALLTHEAVAEAAVVAAPDEDRGSVVRAIVVLRSGHEPSRALADALQTHVKGQTAPYKYPRIVDFAEQLPKTESGKIRRAELRNG